MGGAGGSKGSWIVCEPAVSEMTCGNDDGGGGSGGSGSVSASSETT